MHVVRFVSKLGFALGFAGVMLAGASARADVAPPNDGGSVVDMAVAKDLSTVAQPDFASFTKDDGGCSMVAPGKASHGSALLIVAAGMAAFAFTRRKHNA